MKNRGLMAKLALCILICVLFAANGHVEAALAKGDLISDTKEGIVEIYYGFKTEDGTFHRMKHASGFVVSNQEDQAYVVTVCNAIKSTAKGKKKYCKKNGIPYDKNSLQDSVQIVIKGDVMMEASIVTESQKENYGILRVDGSISEKSPVKLGSDKTLSIGDNVYALGFDQDAGKYDDASNRHTEYLAADVKVDAGIIQDTGANMKGILCLQHSAVITSGNTGGPLLNEEGYVIGLNNFLLHKKGDGAYYSLPIDTVREILDNFGIAYQSIERAVLFQDFKGALKKYQDLLEDNAYKEGSKESLRMTIEEAENLTLDENTDLDEVSEMMRQMEEDASFLKKKMKTTKKIMIVLAVLLACLAIWLLSLIIWKLKHRKQQKSTVADAGTPIPAQTILDGAGDNLGASMERRRPEDSQSGTVLLGFAEDNFTDVYQEQADGFYKRRTKAAVANAKTGRGLRLEKPEVYIGKKEENDIISQNKNVSRRHACISWENGGYYIQDLQSLNGTYVNGEKVEFGNKRRLKNKDHFVLANEEYIFYEVQDNTYR